MDQQHDKLITFVGKWHLFRGMAFGLQQSSMHGMVSVSKLTREQLGQLDACFDLYLREDNPELPSSIDNFEYLLQRLIFWSGAIQRQSGIPVSENYRVWLQEKAEDDKKRASVAIPVVKRKAFHLAVDWVNDLMNRLLQDFADRAPDTQEIFQDLDRIHESLKGYAESGVNKHLIISAANRLDIPVMRLDDKVIVLGTGCHTRWMDSTITDRTSPFGVTIAKNKQYTARLLHAMGLPGAQQISVSSEKEATEAATRLGYPVVVKPADQERGRGVNADLRDSEAVAKAFREAREFSSHLLVEKWFEGFTHRLTVQEDQVIRVTKRVAGGVVGNGQNTVSELVDLWHEDADNQRRSRRLGKVLLSLDEEALDMLSHQGKDKATVPAEGQYVRLRRRDNINAGGTNEYLQLNDVHPDNARLAVDITRFLKMDFAGIDLIMQDIGKSWFEAGALVCEINAKPQMGAGENLKIYDAVLERMMGGHYRVPTRLVICPASGFDQEQLARVLLKDTGYNGVSTQSGLFIDDRKVTGAFKSGFDAAQALLIRPEVRGAFCVMTPAELASSGLPHNHWQDCRMVSSNLLSEQELLAMERVRALMAPHLADSKPGSEHLEKIDGVKKEATHED